MPLASCSHSPHLSISTSSQGALHLLPEKNWARTTPHFLPASDKLGSDIMPPEKRGSDRCGVSYRVKIAPLNSSRNTPPLELQTNKQTNKQTNVLRQCCVVLLCCVVKFEGRRMPEAYLPTYPFRGLRAQYFREECSHG